jgi:hypothetical protein
MNSRLFISQWYIPDSFKSKKLKKLFEITSYAFTGKVATPSARNYTALLTEYACFTKSQAEQLMANRLMSEAVRNALYESAYGMGTDLRHELGVKNDHEFRVAVRSVYRALKIDFSCDHCGRFMVRRCFFSTFYSGAVCEIIASLDQGLVAGLSGGKKMSFTSRITVQSPCCEGTISV